MIFFFVIPDYFIGAHSFIADTRGRSFSSFNSFIRTQFSRSTSYHLLTVLETAHLRINYIEYLLTNIELHTRHSRVQSHRLSLETSDHNSPRASDDTDFLLSHKPSFKSLKLLIRTPICRAGKRWKGIKTPVLDRML